MGKLTNEGSEPCCTGSAVYGSRRCTCATGVVTEAMITDALMARVPGGSEVWCWLPQKDAFTPHQTARDVMRCALEAALSAQQRG